MTAKEKANEHVRVARWVFWVGIILLVLLGLVVWSVTREHDAQLTVKDPGELRALIPSLVGLTQSSLDQGNRVEILQNGDEFFPPLLRDLAAARESIHFETFIWKDGRIAREIAAVLAQQARRGVEVRVLVDASGGRELTGEVEGMLVDAGAKVAHFHPLRLSNLGRLNNRDHRKLVIVDGRIAYAGGFGIGDSWTGNAQDRKQYRDTNLRAVGPVVGRLQSVFMENWIEETGEIPAGNKYFRAIPRAGNTPAHVASTSPTGSVSSVQILYYLAISAARREILIQNPYLLPDRQAIEALAAAARRGVDVRIMVPSADATDNALVQHASHHHFGTLLKRGVRIWEYERTLLHQKVIVIDGIWSCVGSTNFDDRSLRINDEVSIGLVDPAIAEELRTAFQDDLRFSRERKLEEWRDRGFRHKMTDGLAYLGRPQL